MFVVGSLEGLRPWGEAVLDMESSTAVTSLSDTPCAVSVLLKWTPLRRAAAFARTLRSGLKKPAALRSRWGRDAASRR